VSGGHLAGRRVLVTRHWPELARALAAEGATASEVPAIAVSPPDDPGPLDRALGALAAYDWLVFTSANAVEACRARLEALGLALPPDVRIASVGPATTRALGAAWPGARVRIEPAEDARGAALVEAFAETDLAGRRVLLPVSDRAADVVERGLSARGARVDRVVAYRTAAGRGADLDRALAAGPDAVVLASPSAVEAFLAATGDRGRALAAAVIGPTTAEAARRHGIARLETAPSATVEGLMAALGRLFP